MSKRAEIVLLPLSIFLFITSFISVTLNAQLNNSPFYKGQDAPNNDLTSITQSKTWSDKNQRNIQPLFAKMKITESFVADANNLGIIFISFDTQHKSVNDKIIFRLKPTGQKNWTYQGTYAANQIQDNIPFPFGFPVISNSNGKSYTFQIESLAGKKWETLSLSKQTHYFYAKYKYSKSELVHNPIQFAQFISTKLITQIPFLRSEEIIIILFVTLLPLVIYYVAVSQQSMVEYLMRYKGMRKYLRKYLQSVKQIKGGFLLNRDDKIRLSAIVISIGFYISIAYHYLQGSYLHQKFPINSFLPGGFFFDFFAVYGRWLKFHFNGVGLTYFPGSFLAVDFIKEIFNTNIEYAAYAYVASFVIFMFLLTYGYIKTNKKLETLQNTFIIAFMSYPFLFAFQTGNFEITTFTAVAFFFIFYKRNKMLSIIALAYAISMKVFPGIFLVLLFLEKRYKDIALSILFVVIFTLLPLLIFDGGFNKGIGPFLGNLKQNQQSYIDFMVITGTGDHFGHSFLNGLRTLFTNLISPASMKTLMFPYTVATGIVFLAIVVYLMFVEKTFWKRVACLVMAMDLLPYSSNDYKLLYIYLPLFFLINHSKKERLDIVYILLLCLLMIPKDYFYFSYDPYSNSNIISSPIIMITVLLTIIISGLKVKYLQKSIQ